MKKDYKEKPPVPGLIFSTILITLFLVLQPNKTFSQAVVSWTATGATTAWLTNSNWSGNAFATTGNIAQFNNAGTASTSGINMNTAGGSFSISALDITSARTTNNIIIGNSSGTNGTLNFTSGTVNGVSNVIIRNNSSKNLTIQDNETGSGKIMNMGLGGTTDNKIVLDGAGSITISSIIQGASNRPLSFLGAGSGLINITGTTNTFSGTVSFIGGETVMSADGSFGSVPGSVNAGAIVLNGGRYTCDGTTYTISANRGIKVGSGGSISVKNGAVLTYTGIIADLSPGGSWAKQGANKLVLGGASIYTGTTAINNGTVQLIIGSNRLPTASILNMGQSGSANLGTLDLNGFNQQVAGLNSVSGSNGTASNNVITSATAATLTLGGSGTYSYGDGTNANSGVISGAIRLVQSGTGLQTIGDVNSYTGGNSITGGEIVFTSDAALGGVPGVVTSTAIIIDGGRLTANATYTLNSNRGIQVGNTAGTSISVKSGAVLTYNGIIADKPATTGSWAKQGADLLKLGGVSVYTGTTSVNNGSLQITASNRLPSVTTLNLGQSGSTNLGVFDLNGFNQQVAGINSISGTSTGGDNKIVSAGAATLTIGGNGSYSYGDGTNANSGIITGTISLTKSGSGIQTLGDINSYTGDTQINAGELRFSPNANESLNSSDVTLNGGKLSTTGITSGVSLDFATLNLSNNSTITLESSNSHTLTFTSSNGISWGANKTLTITGWQGTYSTPTGTTGTVGRIFIGNSNTDLTNTQLSQIRFFDGVNYYAAILLNTGELSPYCIAPNVSLVSNNSPVCAGSPLTFSINATGTLTPTFLWSGPNSFTSAVQNPTISSPSILANGIYTITAGNACGVVTNTISAVVNPSVVPTVSVISSANGFCSASPITITFTANPTNGGGAPTFQWKLNGFNVGTGANTYSNNSLVNNDQVFCVMTSNTTCPIPASVNSNTKTISVTTTPTIMAMPDVTVCSGQTVPAINFTTTPLGQSVSWANTNTLTGLGVTSVGNIPAFASSTVTSTEISVVQITPFTGGCFGAPSFFNLVVNGPQLSTVWTGGISNDWFNQANWSNCVCGSVSNATILGGTAFDPVISGTTSANVNDITLDPLSLLTITNSQTLNVNGNWDNNGTFTTQSGEINFSGTNSQIVTGTSTTTFYKVSLNNSSGLVLNSPANIKRDLQLNAGVFDTNNQLTLLADAVESGRIGPINAAADIINQVTVQQYAQSGYTGWALLGSPITSGLTMADWNDNFAITCSLCPDGYYVGGSPFTSIYSYDETAIGNYSASTKYTAINDITDPINFGSGYWAYIGTGYPLTGGIMFDAKGTVAKSNCLSCGGNTVNIPLLYTNQGSPSDDGWNLISNPLPSPVSWTALRNNDPNVDDAIYAFNADLLNGGGGFVSYVNGVPSNTVGGINDTIPMCQGVYVHVTASATLFAGENTKINANPFFLKPAAPPVKPIVRLLLKQAGTKIDQTTLYFENGATVNFEKNKDAYKMIYDPSHPYVCSISSGKDIDISGLPLLGFNVINVPVKAITPVTGNFTFTLNTSNYPGDVCAELYDSYTGITTNILNSTYTCTLFDTTTVARFALRFKTQPLGGTTNVNQPSCIVPNGGKILSVGNSGAPWNYTWRNSMNNIIKTSTNLFGPDSLVLLNGGNYNVTVNSVGTCMNYTQSVTINTIIIPVSQFVGADTVYLSNGGNITFTNNSTNATSYFWNFGDGIGNSAGTDPSYAYLNEGLYNVSLISSSSSMCSDSSAKQVLVLASPVGLNVLSINNAVVLENKNFADYTVKFDLLKEQNIKLQLIDNTGKVILTQKEQAVKNRSIKIDLNKYSRGIYLLDIQTENMGRKLMKLIRD